VGVVDGLQPIIGEQLHCSDTCSIGESVFNKSSESSSSRR